MAESTTTISAPRLDNATPAIVTNVLSTDRVTQHTVPTQEASPSTSPEPANPVTANMTAKVQERRGFADFLSKFFKGSGNIGSFPQQESHFPQQEGHFPQGPAAPIVESEPVSAIAETAPIPAPAVIAPIEMKPALFASLTPEQAIDALRSRERRAVVDTLTKSNTAQRLRTAIQVAWAPLLIAGAATAADRMHTVPPLEIATPPVVSLVEQAKEAELPRVHHTYDAPGHAIDGHLNFEFAKATNGKIAERAAAGEKIAPSDPDLVTYVENYRKEHPELYEAMLQAYRAELVKENGQGLLDPTDPNKLAVAEFEGPEFGAFLTRFTIDQTQAGVAANPTQVTA